MSDTGADSGAGAGERAGERAGEGEPLVIYSTQWCGYCHRLERQLEREGIAFQTINVEESPGAAELVESINHGNRTVPTVIFPDGSSATNPSLAEIKSRLRT